MNIPSSRLTFALARRTANTSASLNSFRKIVLSSRSASTGTSQPVEWEQKEIDPQLLGYPQLPAVSYQKRRPGNWDDPQERRNFGEPIPEEHEILSVWSYDHYSISGGDAARQLAVAVAAFGLFLAAVAAVAPERPSIPRQYPRSGLVNELGGIEENKANEESIDQ